VQRWLFALVARVSQAVSQARERSLIEATRCVLRNLLLLALALVLVALVVYHPNIAPTLEATRA